MEVVEFSMTVAQVAVDASASCGVGQVIGMGEGEALEDSELGFDQVDPGSVGGRVDGVNVQAPQQGEKTRVVMDIVQVVQNHGQTLAPESPERFRNFPEALPAAEHTTEAVGMDIVETQKLLGAFQSAVGRADPLGLLLPCPSDAAQWLEFQRPPFVEADYGAVGRAAPIKRPDAFFLRSKSGSVEVFQVRTRWALSPSRRRRRRTH
jgi:hypothetical protein